MRPPLCPLVLLAASATGLVGPLAVRRPFRGPSAAVRVATAVAAQLPSPEDFDARM